MPIVPAGRDRRISVLSAVMLVVVVSASSILSPRLFHTLAEASFVAVGYAAFVMAWNLRRFSDDDFFLFVSRALVVVGVLQLLHALTYPGVGIVPGATADLSCQFVLAAGLLAGCAFDVAPFIIGRRLNPAVSTWVFWIARCLVIVVLARLVAPLPRRLLRRRLTVAFCEHPGGREYPATRRRAGSLVLRRRRLRHGSLIAMIAALAAMAAYEAGLVLPGALTGRRTSGRHILLIVSALCIYRAVVQSGLTRPMALAVDDLERRQRAADARYSTLIEQSPMGVFVVDQESTIVAPTMARPRSSVRTRRASGRPVHARRLGRSLPPLRRASPRRLTGQLRGSVPKPLQRPRALGGGARGAPCRR